MVSFAVWSSRGRAIGSYVAAGGNQTAIVDPTTEVSIPNRTLRGYRGYMLHSDAGRRTGRACCEQPTRHSR